MPPPPAAGGIRFGGPGDFPSLSEDDDKFDWTALCFFAFQLQLFVYDSLCFFLCSDEAEDLATSPRARAASPNRVATPPVSNTLLQPEATMTTLVTPKEKTVVMPILSPIDLGGTRKASSSF